MQPSHQNEKTSNMKSTYDISNLPQIPGSEVAILQAEWYSEYSDTMVKHCSEILTAAGVSTIHHQLLPGTHELPLAARDIIRAHPKIDAVILFGIVIKGETYHFEMILDTVSRGIERVMFEEDTPIINEIIPAYTLDQVEARTKDDETNKGREAALAAVKVITMRSTPR
jgi:6,7-dimethyl-8-ribityllumazine synthase